MNPVSRDTDRKTLVICGPTACGKSDLSDLAADLLSERFSNHVPVMVVDSMQVYKEIPAITNQNRRRKAELVGVVSVAEEWTMARHRFSCDEISAGAEGPSVMDAGTGMYLNAILLDIPIAPRVPKEVREKAEFLSEDEINPRRASREKELKLAGVEPRGSIWDGVLRYEVEMIYLRPSREKLDFAISERSARISRDGLEEAENLMKKFSDGIIPNSSVKDSIGVRELVSHLRGQIPLWEAEQSIITRTRKLSRKQIRWFDKLARTLEGRSNIRVAQDAHSAKKAVHEHIDRFQEYYT